MSVTLAGYESFITNYMKIPVAALPLNDPIILMTLAIAEELVITDLKVVTSPCGSTLGYTQPNVYELAVYNLAADFLINFAQDQPRQNYFANARAAFGINNFVAGVISESHDESTGQSILTPDFMKNLTLSDLQRLKTPFGRTYLQLVQGVGTLWGLS